MKHQRWYPSCLGSAINLCCLRRLQVLVERDRGNFIKYKPAGSHSICHTSFPHPATLLLITWFSRDKKADESPLNPSRDSWQRKAETSSFIWCRHCMLRTKSDSWTSKPGTHEKVHILCPFQGLPSYKVFPILLFATEIIKKVKKPPPLCRPNVAPDVAPLTCIQVMKQCWAEAPERRPTFEEVFHKVSK